MKRIILIPVLVIISVFMCRPELVSMVSLPQDDGIGSFIISNYPPEISADSILIGDADTGKVLYRKNADDIRQIASLAKIMTAVVVLENKSLDSLVKVTKKAKELNSWLLKLRKGQKITLKDLVFAFLLESRNDAAYYAAESVGSNEKGFVRMMNEKARQIGADSTIFCNCHGLETGGSNLSTASDLFMITRYALGNPVFSQIVQMKEADISWTGQVPHRRRLKNVNKMLSLYDGVDGVKTGYTKAAGKCIIVSCKKKDRRLICILLNSENIWKESTQMLDYAFAKAYIDENLR